MMQQVVASELGGVAIRGDEGSNTWQLRQNKVLNLHWVAGFVVVVYQGQKTTEHRLGAP